IRADVVRHPPRRDRGGTGPVEGLAGVREVGCTMPVLYLTEDDVRQVLTMDVALPAVEAAFRKLSLDEAENVPRQRCQTDHVMLHVLPAAARTLGALGFKAYTVSKAGAKFLVTLFDPKAGGMTALVEADLLGQFRTG